MIESLFIGGANDGKRMLIPSQETVIQVPVPSSGVQSDGRIPGVCVRESEAYRAEWFQANGETHRVFIRQGVTIEGALRLLLANYQPKK